MRVIDFHTHIWPDKVAPGAVSSLAERAHVKPNTDGTLGALRRSMQEAGVYLSVILPVITKVSQFDSITRFANEINEKYDDLISFGAVFPGDPEYKGHLRILKDYGFRGIKIHPDYHGIDFDAKESMDLVYEASTLGMVISVHAGIDIGLPDNPCSTPQMAARVLDEIHPKKLVLAHTGGWKLWDDVEKYLVGRDVYFDTAFTAGFMDNEQWTRIIRNHGVDKVAFGTDSPWSGQKESIEAIKKLGLTDEERDVVFSGTACHLLEM